MIEATANRLTNWAMAALPRAKLLYYVGYLAKDRLPSWAGRLSSASPAAVEIGELAEVAWRLYERGIVTLVQERIDADVYRYLAIKTKRIMSASVAA